jgi:hypothetical protein
MAPVKPRVVLKRILGEGKSGTVWEGQLENQKVAVKVGTCLAADDVLKRERTAYEALASLQGTVIPRLFGSGWTPRGRRFLMLEQIVGRSLDQVRQTFMFKSNPTMPSFPFGCNDGSGVEERSRRRGARIWSLFQLFAGVLQ